MADCYTSTEKRFNSNGAIVFVPVACPASTGLPTLVQLEGQQDGSISFTADTVEVRDKGSGRFKEYLPTSVGAEVSISGNVYVPEDAPAQTITWESALNQVLVGIQFQVGAAPAVGKVGLSYFAKARATSWDFSAPLDNGSVDFTMTLQLTGDISQDANNIKVIV